MGFLFQWRAFKPVTEWHAIHPESQSLGKGKRPVARCSNPKFVRARSTSDRTGPIYMKRHVGKSKLNEGGTPPIF
jgi:hypothetical protein